MKLSLDSNLKTNPIPLPFIVDPNDAKYIVQLCVLHAMDHSWQIFGETNREIAKESALEARLSARKSQERRISEILASHIRLDKKQGAQNKIRFKSYQKSNRSNSLKFFN